MHRIALTPTLVARVLEIAREAGRLIMGVYTQMNHPSAELSETSLRYKSDNSPLTQADLLAHQLINEMLMALTPDIPVVSEEDEHSWQYRLPTGDFWLVDPLDGTKEFLAQNGEFTVNIALVRDGRAVLGVVLAPALGQAYWGAWGMGSQRECMGCVDAIQVGHSAEPLARRCVRVLASKSHMNAETMEFISQLGQHVLVQAGSSLKFCRIAEGSADVYPRMGPTCEWDTAAAQAIVEAAGGHVTLLNGTPLRYGKPDLLNPHFIASGMAFVTTR